MSPFDCDLDFDAPPGQCDDQFSSIELTRMFGCDEPEKPMEPQVCDALYEAALQWARRGYNVVPQKAPDKKHPGVKWAHLQTCRVTEAELQSWRRMFGNGVGFVTGEISGVIVVETDGPEGEERLAEFQRLHGPFPQTLAIRSGSGRGLHRHFKHPGHSVPTRANHAIKIDVKGDGGFCVLPPSVHKSGGHYEIMHDAEPAELPEGLLEFIEAKAAQEKTKGEATRENRVCNRFNGFGEMPEYLRKFGRANLLPVETCEPPPAGTMRRMLKHLADKNCFAERFENEKDADGRIRAVGWLKCGMALKPAYGDEVGFELWAITHIDDRARNDAPTQWVSFASKARPGDVTIATIIKAAKETGFVMPSPPEGEGAEAGEVMVRHEDTHGDIKNGKLFAEMFRAKLLFVHETRDVLAFDEQSGWVHAQPNEDVRGAKAVVAILRAHAADEWKRNPEDSKTKALMRHVEYSSKDANLQAMIRLAQSEPGMTVRLGEFDDDPMLLGVLNGVLDLRNGTLIPVSPSVLVSKRCNVAYDPNAKCPRLLKYIVDIQPDVDIRDYLQRFAGYCLTGRVDEHVFTFLYGHGANGKSVFVELINWLLGAYANKIQTEMLMKHQRNPQGHSADIVALKGLRFVYANETSEGGD